MESMNFNFFEWIRDAVKRSVLMGVSDAVETMGMPPEEKESKDKILGFLQQDKPKRGGRKRIGKTGGTSNTGPRKLGRSINEMHSSGSAKTPSAKAS
jgi:hypothetical protein